MGDGGGGEYVRAGHLLSVVHLPTPTPFPVLGEAPARAAAAGVVVIVNRPLGMGTLVPADDDAGRSQALRAAYRFVLDTVGACVVLTGTTSPDHLTENAYAFQAARELSARAR